MRSQSEERGWAKRKVRGELHLHTSHDCCEELRSILRLAERMCGCRLNGGLLFGQPLQYCRPRWPVHDKREP